MDKSILGVKVPITAALTPRSTILIVGRILRTAPNTVQRHFETLRNASTRAMRISDADGMLVPGAMRDVWIGTRDFLDPPFYIVEMLLRATRINPRNVDFFHCRDHLDAKPRRCENMTVFLEATLQSHASALMVCEIDTQRNYNN
jgi:hypothetical protein